MAVTHETHPNRSIYRDPFWDHCPFWWYRNGNKVVAVGGFPYIADVYYNVCIIIRHGGAACSSSA